MIEMGNTVCTKEQRNEFKYKVANICYVCGKKESDDNNDVTLVKCGVCKYYSYCGKDCQTRQMSTSHIVTQILQTILCKEIREAIIGGQDPKEIHTLQRLRMKLGLNRLKEEYEELLLSLADYDNNNNNNNNTTNKNIIMKRGTTEKIKGLVKASKHNGKCGIVTKESIPGEGRRRCVGVKLSDDSGTVFNIKIENLDILFFPGGDNNSSSDHLNPHEYLTARKDEPFISDPHQMWSRKEREKERGIE